MYNVKFLKTLTVGVVLTMAICSQAFAQEATANPFTFLDVLRSMYIDNTPENYVLEYAHIARYNNDDGSYARVSTGSAGYEFNVAYYDNQGNRISETGHKGVNFRLNGEAFGNVGYSSYKPTYDIDNQGRIIAAYESERYGGALQETYKYAEDGQMLAYNSQGQLIGAFDNWFGKRIFELEYSNKPADFNHLSDGKYAVKDSNNNILEEYYANGDYIKNSYNSEGNLISSSKYDKDGDIIESSVNKYDGAGNLTAAYKNGVSTYKRTSYTPAEAAAALKKGNVNKVTLTFK